MKPLEAFAALNPLEVPPLGGGFDWGPGAKTFVGYDVAKDQGYLGVVSAAELISGDALAAHFGLAAGNSMNSTAGWLKFWDEGVIKFIAKKPFRSHISRDNIHAAGIADGTELTIGGRVYTCRLVTGGTYSSPWHYCANDKGGGSEWNELLYRVHSAVPTCADHKVGSDSQFYDGKTHGGPQSGANWAAFSSTDLGTGYINSNAGASWTLATNSNQIARGYYGIVGFYQYSTSMNDDKRCWRPLLELQQ